MKYTAEVVQMLSDELYYRQMLHDAGKEDLNHPYFGPDGMGLLIEEFENLVTNKDIKIPRNTSAYHELARKERARRNRAAASARYYQKNKADNA